MNKISINLPVRQWIIKSKFNLIWLLRDLLNHQELWNMNCDSTQNCTVKHVATQWV